MAVERRPRTTKACPIEGCDWILVTSEFVGGPDKVREIGWTEQQVAAGAHMRTHYTPERTFFT